MLRSRGRLRLPVFDEERRPGHFDWPEWWTQRLTRLSYRTNMGVGTPQRISDLIDQGKW